MKRGSERRRDSPVGESSRYGPTRRRLLGVLGAATVPLAGCPLGGSTSTETPTDGPVTTPAGTRTHVEQLSEGFSDRVNDLLDAMSVYEQAGQTVLHAARDASPAQVESTIESTGVGGLLYGGARAPNPGDPAAVAEVFNGFQRTATESSSQDVPLVVGIDAVHGNATVQPAAVFPHNVGLGATWDTALAQRIGAVTARSMRALGMQWNYAPVADLAHDPRWGRFYECLSQDPLVTGEFVAAYVEGLQTPTETGRAASTVKHFAGNSVVESGDDRANADVSRRRLRTRVLPPYRAGVDAGAETVMAATAAINGVPAHASEWLLGEVLRSRWGFDGLATADWEDVRQLYTDHQYVASYRDAVRVAINAGLDVTMAPRNVGEYLSILTGLVETGDVAESRLRTAAGRMLQLKERLGLFDSPTVDPSRASEQVVRRRDRELALEAARKSMTVLRGDPLPLEDGGTVLVTGPSVESTDAMCGGWSIGWQGPTDVVPDVTTVRDGIERVTASETTVQSVSTGRRAFDNRSAVASAAADADTVVVAFGEGAYAEHHGDVDELGLPTAQRELVDTVADADATSVGVLLAGRPRGRPATLERLDGFVMGYYPGSQGGTAVAETLFGDNPHRGALPFTWPTSIGQGVASDHERRAIDAVDEPLYSFGDGGHSAVAVSLDSLSTTELSADGSTTIDATVGVSSDADRRLTVPVIVRGIATTGAPSAHDPTVVPAMGVVGFDRVGVDAGASTTTSLPLELGALGTVGGGVTGDGKWTLPAGRYRIAIGEATTSVDVQETVDLG